MKLGEVTVKETTRRPALAEAGHDPPFAATLPSRETPISRADLIDPAAAATYHGTTRYLLQRTEAR